MLRIHNNKIWESFWGTVKVFSLVKLNLVFKGFYALVESIGPNKQFAGETFHRGGDFRTNICSLCFLE